MALTAPWMSASDMLGVKAQTFGPSVAVTAAGQRLVDGEGAAALVPAAVAVSPAAARATTLKRRRTIRCMKAPHWAGVRNGKHRTRSPFVGECVRGSLARHRSA